MQLNRYVLLVGVIVLCAALPSVAQEVQDSGGGASEASPPPGVQSALPLNASEHSSKTETTPSQAASIEGNTALIRIDRFDVKGNTLLDPALIENLLSPFKGEGRSYTDIQRALDALEGAYRNAGYSAVHVTTPEQEITQGAITFIVVEAVVGKVVLSGNENYDKDNIRNALPALAEGFTPSARGLSENIRLANESPTRQLDVVLAVGEEENTVDAKVNVTDSFPGKTFFTLDNTGSQNTGMYRMGVGYQYNNLFNKDHAVTLNYITAPGRVNTVSQYAVSYRLPIYSLGDSIDLIAAKSDTNAGTTSTVAGPLSFSGKGHIYGVHYNHYLPRDGDYASKIVAGLDYRAYINNCSIGGAAVCGNAGADVTVHPVSLTYNGTLTKPAHVVDYTATIMHNIPGGSRGGDGDFLAAARPSMVLGAPAWSGARADFNILRLNGSVAGALPENWQYRVAGNAQLTRNVLVSGEQLGLVGANAVRGFIEREISREKGYVLNIEVYTPELAPKLGVQNGSLRLLGFVDRASGWNNTFIGESTDMSGPPNFESRNILARTSVGSAGVGLRFSYSKNIMAKLDVARVAQCDDLNINTKVGDKRGSLSLVGSW